MLLGETPTHQLSDTERFELAERLGYRSVGAQLPKGVTLSKINSTLPRDVSPLGSDCISNIRANPGALLSTESSKEEVAHFILRSVEKEGEQCRVLARFTVN